MSYTYVNYEEAQNLLQEGDVLLFRGTSFISSLIKMAGQGEYSHVAVASKHNGHWESIEWREWLGSRIINLENYIKISEKSKTYIDVYRACPVITKLEFNQHTRHIDYVSYDFDGKKITELMRVMTGMPYSYRRILTLLKLKLFKWKILQNIEQITKELPTDDLVMPVCSTAVAYCFAKNNWPLLRRKNSDFMEPSDISRSTRLNYIFTLNV